MAPKGTRRATAESKPNVDSVDGGGAKKRQRQRKPVTETDAYQDIARHGAAPDLVAVKTEPGTKGLCIRDIFAKQVASTMLATPSPHGVAVAAPGGHTKASPCALGKASPGACDRENLPTLGALGNTHGTATPDLTAPDTGAVLDASS